MTCQPPPNPFISNTLAFIRRVRIPTAVRWLASAAFWATVDLEVAGEAAAIAVGRLHQRALRGVDGALLDRRLLVEDAQRGELILDFAERDQHRLAVDRGRLILRGARLIRHGAPASRVEDVDEQRRTRSTRSCSCRSAGCRAGCSRIPRRPTAAAADRTRRSRRRAARWRRRRAARRRRCRAAARAAPTAGPPAPPAARRRAARRRSRTRTRACRPATAIACSSAARPTPTSTACARVVSSTVSACATSACDAMPPWKRFCVSSSAFSNDSTAASSSCAIAIDAAQREVVDRELGVEAEARRLEVGGARLRGRAARARRRCGCVPRRRLRTRRRPAGRSRSPAWWNVDAGRLPDGSARADRRDDVDLSGTGRRACRARARAPARTAPRPPSASGSRRRSAASSALSSGSPNSSHQSPRSAVVGRLRRSSSRRFRGRPARRSTVGATYFVFGAQADAARRPRPATSAAPAAACTRRARHWLLASATRTAWPASIESGALTTIRSRPVRPDTTSTLLPKSRPSVTGCSAHLAVGADHARPARLRSGR